MIKYSITSRKPIRPATYPPAMKYIEVQFHVVLVLIRPKPNPYLNSYPKPYLNYYPNHYLNFYPKLYLNSYPNSNHIRNPYSNPKINPYPKANPGAYPPAMKYIEVSFHVVLVFIIRQNTS